ncbi:MAG: methyl-accepting chemotaxis protein, partial [Thiobacillus sp.]
EMTQQTAALVEEAAAAAESLQEQAARLADAVSVFKLEPPVLREPVAVLPARSKPVAVPALRTRKLAVSGRTRCDG